METTPDSVLPLFYFGPVGWYAHFLRQETNTIEIHEHFIRQTWRNRMRILGPNGAQDLVIPVHAPNRTPMKDVLIDFSSRWQQRHWGAIRTAYGQSPFFLHYKDAFEQFYLAEKWETLVSLNTAILDLMLKLLKTEKTYSLSISFLPYNDNDVRLKMSPGKTAVVTFPPYIQNFSERHGFVPDLSILDLLYSIGPESKNYLLKVNNP